MLTKGVRWLDFALIFSQFLAFAGDGHGVRPKSGLAIKYTSPNAECVRTPRAAGRMHSKT
jgi:hypothetical protein